MVYRSDYVKKWLDYIQAIISQNMDMCSEGKKSNTDFFIWYFVKIY